MMDIYDKEKIWQAEDTCKRSNGHRIGRYGHSWVLLKMEDGIITSSIYPTFRDAMDRSIEILEAY